MRKKNTNEQLHTQPQFRLKPVYAAVLLAFAVQTAQANPIGGTVAAGQASFATAGNTLNVTNTPGTIINWQGFSIGANEITHFVQQSASSAVLNRVISNNPSSILGTLQSNGRVFLINPGGIVFGAGATVDVAGMVASTLNLSNADFLAGRNHFTQVPGSANVSNAGNITAQNGGQIYLIAPDVENTGVITAPNGEILLAAGHSVDLVSTTNPNLRVNITAPAGDATNVGQLIAQSGSLGLFGTVVRNSGTVNADSATMQGGKIVFKASLRVEAGGTITANGTNGGSVDVSAAHSLDPNAPGVVIQTGSIQAQGTAGAGGAVSLSGDSILSAAAINADGTTAGGRISVQANNRALSTVAAQYTTDSTLGAGGDILVSADVSNYTSGSYSATGTTGGNLALAGNEIKLAGAQLDASGTNGGGNIYIGGLMHGAAGFSAQGIALTNATNVLTNSATSLKADALQTGNGGEVVLWSDQAMSFKGNISAKGGVLGGNGGMAEISGLTSLGYNGLTDLSATNGLNGTLLLDPRNITIVAGPGALAGAASPSVLELIDPNPGAGYGFGGSMTELANGNIAIASPNDGFVAANAGAVFLYSPAGSLLSTLTGSAVNDNVGSGGITQLAINGNFVVVSPNWGAGVSTTPLGAVTWGSATAGVSGTVSPANSVVGTLANDQVGRGYSGAPVVALTNGNYVVTSPFWNSTAGAATWVDGTTGHVSDYAANGNTNVISSANSLVGVPGDFVGVKVIALPINGNYVVGGSSAGTATATWVNGTNGQTSDASNTISLANSLMGASQPYALTNGNYVVVNGFYAGSGSQRGVATWVNGTTGLTSDGLNVISAANSIIGQTNNDMIGQNGVIALPNGNYVLANFDWNYTSGYGGWGAVTWVNGSTGKTSNGLNVISQSNSVVGNNTGEQVGAKVVVLTNGNYVIGSYNWPGYGTSAGAATWVNGSTGLTKDGLGVISSANSWLGVNPYDMVGFNITALSNGNYVVGSPFWNGNRGAVTWGDGATGSVGFVGLTNSLVGSAPSDYVGASGYLGGNTVFALPGGNYVVGSGYWNASAGAVTWGNGATAGTRTVGTISSTNSIVGAVSGVSSSPPTILSNGNYVVGNSSWNGGMGAATWVNGSNGQVSDYAANGNTNIVSATNSLVGSVAGDNVGGIGALSNGNYVVLSANWNGGMGAATWVNGTTGQVPDYAANSNTNIVSAANSLVGSTAGDQVGNGGITELGNNNYAVNSYSWNNGALTAAGAVTWSDSLGATVGAVSAFNSLLGSSASENLGTYVVALQQGANLGNAYVGSSGAANGTLAGAGRAFILGATVAGTTATGTLFTDTPATDVTIGAGYIAATLNLGTNVLLQANNDITQQAGAGITATTGLGNLTMRAGRSVVLGDVIHIGGALDITANDAGITAAEKAAIAANRSAGTAVLDTSLATLTASAINLTATGGNLNVNGTVSASVVTVSADTFTLSGGTWSQVSATLPGFTVNDFRIAGGTFIRALSGDGSSATPYQLTDIYGVQGIGSAGMLGKSYVLANSINAAGTVNWNAGAGFVPVGNATTGGFTGQFDGLGNTISNLYIYRPTESDVGLFGYVSGGGVSNVGLVNDSVTGGSYVGGLVGDNYFGTISNSYVSSGFVGGSLVGGLVGISNGVITNAHYNINGVTINDSSNVVTQYGLYNDVVNKNGVVGQYDDWLNGGLPTPLNIANYATLSGSGNNYSIHNEQGMKDLLGFADNAAYNFTLQNDISLLTVSGLYIPFLAANFDGVGHTISKLNVNQPFNDNLGLFGHIALGSTVRNVVLSNAVVTGNSHVGALAGWNEGNIINSHVSAAIVSGGSSVGGLVGNDHRGVISNSYVDTGTVVSGGQYVGGLLGWDSGEGIIQSNTVTDTTVKGNDYVGGLAGKIDYSCCTVGYSDDNHVINSIVKGGTTNSIVKGGITVSVGLYVGGLVGWNGTPISNSSVSGGTVTGSSNVGGLVGYNHTAGTTANGALRGGHISNSYVSGGTVTGSSNVGGLVGYNLGKIVGSYVDTGTIVSGSSSVGGLVGYNSGTISKSYVSGGTVTGSSNVGGLVGLNQNSISNNFVDGVTVTGGSNVGGLVGLNRGGTGGAGSYGTADSTGTTGATGSTTTISNSYVSGGTVSGVSNVGGLVGQNSVGMSGPTGSGSHGGPGGSGGAATISNTYASNGNVSSSGALNIGGLVGNNAYGGSVSASFWNTTVAGAGVSTGIGYDPSAYGGAIGMTDVDMKIMANFNSATPANGNINPGWDIANTGGAGKIWRIYEGSTTPLLTSFLKPLTVTANDATKTYDANTFSGGNGVSYSVAGAGSSVFGTPIYGGTSQGVINTGSYTITVAGLYSNQQGYDIISYVDGALTITPLAVKLAIALAGNKVYDGTPTFFTGQLSISNAVSEDVVSLSAGTADTADKNVGVNKPFVSFSGLALTGASAGNYTLTGVSGSGTITPASLTVTADYTSKILNTTDPLLTYMVSGLKSPDTLTNTLSGALARLPGEAVGAYQINKGTLGLITTNFASTNYKMTYVSASFTILVPTVINEIVDISNQRHKKPEDVLAADTSAGNGGNTPTLPVCN